MTKAEEYTHALCAQLKEWYPPFHFEPINAKLGRVTIGGKWGDDVSPLREVGIEPRNEKDWARDCVTWSFWITKEVIEKVCNRIKNKI